MADNTPNNDVDFTKMADDLDNFRELARSLVAALLAEGFTDRESHRIATHIMAPPPPADEAGSKTLDPDIALGVYCEACFHGPLTLEQAAAHETENHTVGHAYSLRRIN